jgi:hypothetical protein
MRDGAGRWKLGFVVILFGVLFAGLSCVVVSQPEAPRRVLVFVDGRPAGSVMLHPGATGELVALGSLARTLGWRAMASGDALELSGESRRLRLAAGTTRVLEEGAETTPLSVPAVRIDAALYVAVADIGDLLFLRAEVRGNALMISTAALDPSAVSVTERALPPAPSPSPVRSAANQPAPPPMAVRQAASLSLSLNSIGSQRFYEFGIISNGADLRSNLLFSGESQIGPPSGSVTVGPLAHSTTIGDNTDPLSGIILRNGSLIGVDVANRDTGTDLVAGRRNDGQTLAGWSHRTSGGSEGVAVVAQDGHFNQFIARRTYEKRYAWGVVQREVLAGTRGVGTGLYARTNGRTFYEATVTDATRGLPLQMDDAPRQVDVGRKVSNNVTVRAGFVSAYGLAFTPFASVFARANDTTFSATLGKGTTAFGGAYQTDRLSAEAYLGGGIDGRSTYVHIATPVRRMTLAFQVLDTSSGRDTTLELQTQGHVVNFLAGVESVGQTVAHLGPVVGMLVPVLPGLSAQLAFNPTEHGNNLKAGLVATFKARNSESSVPSDRVAISVIDGDRAGPMTLSIDGAPAKSFTGSSIVADIVRGPHIIAVTTDDGKRGSADTTLDVKRGATLSLALVPIRTIRGHVRIIAALNEIPGAFTLAGTTVLVRPMGLVAPVDADGAFAFYNIAIAPGSTLIVDPNGLPPDLELQAPVPVPETDGIPAELILVPTRKVERKSFPALP